MTNSDHKRTHEEEDYVNRERLNMCGASLHIYIGEAVLKWFVLSVRAFELCPNFATIPSMFSIFSVTTDFIPILPKLFAIQCVLQLLGSPPPLSISLSSLFL